MMKGHVTKQKRGEYYYFVIDVGRDPETGKRKQRWFKGGKTKKETQAALTKKLAELQNGTYVEKTNQTVGSFSLQWLQGKKPSVRAGSFSVYQSYVNLYINRYIGKVPLQDLTARQIQKMYSDLSESIATNTIRKVHNTLQAILDEALSFGLISKNVARLIQAPSSTKSKMNYWNEEQVLTFLAVARKSRLYIACLLGVTTGMRVGEILGLRWQDIDFEREKLSIIQTLSQSGSEFSETKTDGSRRSVALPDETLRSLKQHKVVISKEKLRVGSLYEDYDLVVCTSLGKPVHPANFRNRWRKLVMQADVPYIRFHDLRHTHATLLLKQGVHPKIVSERLGHSNIQVTLNTYSHIMPGLQEEAVMNFNDFLFHKTTFPDEKQNKI